MIFTLKAYNDLGRCSYATLRDSIDTERDKIYDDGKLVKIEKLEDLFPYLWRQPGEFAKDENGSNAFFHGSVTTHWHEEFDDTVKEYDDQCKSIVMEMTKKTGAEFYELSLKLEEIDSRKKVFVRMLEQCDEDMAEQQRELLEENRLE